MKAVKSVETPKFKIMLKEDDSGMYFIEYERTGHKGKKTNKLADLGVANKMFGYIYNELCAN